MFAIVFGISFPRILSSFSKCSFKSFITSLSIFLLITDLFSSFDISPSISRAFAIINLYIDSIMKKMSATEEKSLIESGQSDQLFDYIVLNQLHGVNVPKFFELATAPTVKYYLRHYSLSQDNEIELLKTQNLSYLEVYFEMYPLS